MYDHTDIHWDWVTATAHGTANGHCHGHGTCTCTCTVTTLLVLLSIVLTVTIIQPNNNDVSLRRTGRRAPVMLTVTVSRSLVIHGHGIMVNLVMHSVTVRLTSGFDSSLLTVLTSQSRTCYMDNNANGNAGNGNVKLKSKLTNTDRICHCIFHYDYNLLCIVRLVKTWRSFQYWFTRFRKKIPIWRIWIHVHG